VLVLRLRGIYEGLHSQCFIWYVHVYILSFRKTGTGAQAILMFCLKNLRDCSIRVTDGRNYEALHGDGLRWHNIHNQVSVQSISSGIEILLRLLSQQSKRPAMMALLMGQIYEVHRSTLPCVDRHTYQVS
jgi:hypothetical protein